MKRVCGVMPPLASLFATRVPRGPPLPLALALDAPAGPVVLRPPTSMTSFAKYLFNELSY